jgi:hypothetical protein
MGPTLRLTNDPRRVPTSRMLEAAADVPLMCLSHRALATLTAEFRSPKRAAHWLARLAQRRGRPVLVNVPTADGSRTVALSPRGWSEERLLGWLAGHAGLMATPQLRGATLVIDRTGVGRAIFDLFLAEGLTPIGITITGGDQVVRDGGSYHVPKRDLVGVVQALLQGGRLKVAAALPEAATLTRELETFRVKLSAAGHDSYDAREGGHDDVLLATALPLWAAEEGLPLTVEFY